MRFIRLVIALWLLVVVLIGGLTLYRRSQPISDDLQTLAYCDGQPCFLGITLRKSIWEDAKRILTGIPDAKLSSIFQGIEALNGPIHRVIVFDSEDGPIFEIDYQFFEDTVHVGGVIAHLGVPCAVYPMPANYDPQHPYTVILGFSKITVKVYVKNSFWRIEPTSAVSTIELGGPFWALGRPANDHEVDRCQGVEGAVKFKWKGFRSYPYP